MTPLDAAWLAVDAGGGEDARLRFFALLLETDLCVPVRPGEAGAPLAFDFSDGPAALAFDDDARMAAFFEAPTEYVSLSGRALAGELARAGLGLGLNFGDAPSAQLLDAQAIGWLAAEMGGRLEAEALEGPLRLGPPQGIDPALPAALAARAAAFPGMIAEAWLVRVGRDGPAETGPGRLVALVALAPAARRAAEGLCAALAAAAAPHAPAGEPVDAAALPAGDERLRAAARVGLPLHAPPSPPEQPRAAQIPAPPRLR